VVALIAMPALAVLPGCLGTAVHSIHENFASSQPLLRDSVSYFSGGIRATVVLIPVKKGHLGAEAASWGNDQNNTPVASYKPPTPGTRMVLLTILTNSSGASADIKVRSDLSAIGMIKNKTFTLAPGQRVILEPLWSAREQNLQNLGVTLTLELQGVIEENKIFLARP
jgi:hypothetical protein